MVTTGDFLLKLIVAIVLAAVLTLVTGMIFRGYNDHRKLTVEKELYLICLEQQKTTEVNLYCRL